MLEENLLLIKIFLQTLKYIKILYLLKFLPKFFRLFVLLFKMLHNIRITSINSINLN